MKRLTDEEMTQIRERAERASKGPWMAEVTKYGSYTITSPDYLYGEMFEIAVKEDAAFIAHAREDIPKLLAEIETLNGLVGHYKGYADRFSDDASEYKLAIRNLDALAESVRYQLRRHQDAESVADEIIEIISDLERKVGDIV